MALNGQLYPTQKRTMSGVKRTVKDYSESTTIHGISYIFESGLSALERLLWICVVCVFLGFAVGLSVQAYINWKDNQVLTTIGTTGYPIEKIEFPAITVCAQVKFLVYVSAVAVAYTYFHHLFCFLSFL